MINRFHPKLDKHRAMTHTVSYHGIVPMPRGLAYALYHIDKHGGHVDVFSADRTDAHIKEHNRIYHTNLHGQQYLFDHQNEPGFNPANPPTRTSHCWYSDGNRAYRVNGKLIPPGHKLPWYMLGIDLSDEGKREHPDHFIAIGRSLGYKIVQPYPSGGEHHHIVFTESPVANLVRWNVISKDRS